MRASVFEVGQGPPILFLHGGGACAASWAPLLGRIRARMICVDRPGHGRSDPFTYRGVDLRAHAVDFVASTLDALGVERAPIVGNSIGGTWALWFALAKPERVASIVLVGAPPGLLGTTPPFGMRVLSLRGLNRLMLRGVLTPAGARSIMQRMGHDPSRMSPELIELMRALSAVPSYWPAWRTLIESVLSLRGPRLPIGAEDLARIRAPVLYLFGDRDTHGALSVAERACSILPRARLHRLDAGHLVYLDTPDMCARLISETVETHEPASRSIAPA
jgi:pimeloyl-ACP methyl ester carboxylesterase